MNRFVSMTEATKVCPRCAEEIRLRASACRFCGAEFTLTTRGYCTQCHDVVTVAGAEAVCSRCGADLVDPTIDTELAPHPLPPPEPVTAVAASPPAPSPAMPAPASGAEPAGGLAPVEPTGRVRRALATTTRHQIGFYLASLAALTLIFLPILSAAIEPMRVWQREVGFLRQTRLLGPLFSVLGVAILAAGPKQLLPRTIGGSRWRAVAGGRRSWIRALPTRAGTRMLVGYRGIWIRLVASIALWLSVGLLFQSAFGDELSSEGVERLPGATVTLVVMVAGLAGMLLMIPGAKARVLDIDDEGEIVRWVTAPAGGQGDPSGGPRPPRGTLVGPVLIALMALAALTAAAILIFQRDDTDSGSSGTTVPSPVTLPDATEDVEPGTAPDDEPADEPAITTEPADDVDTTRPSVVTTAPAATGDNGPVTVVGSNAIADDSFWAIDGETRRLHLFVELRNDGDEVVRVGQMTISIRSASGTLVGTRYAYPFDQVLDPGEVTFASESTPSLTYFEGETNTYPEDWTTWDLSFEVDSGYEPAAWEDVHLDVSTLEVQTGTIGLEATGVITNDTDTPVVGSIEVYVAVHAADGSLLVVGWTIASTTDGAELAPGASTPFELTFDGDVSADGATYVAGALATPVL